MVGHVAPEAAVGGPIAALRDGDEIVIVSLVECWMLTCRRRAAGAAECLDRAATEI
jgi:dihydroxyacid dehydratase/phosphogluconate dehydratase